MRKRRPRPSSQLTVRPGYDDADQLADVLTRSKPQAGAIGPDYRIANIVLRDVSVYDLPFLPPPGGLTSPNGRSYWPYDDSNLLSQLPNRPPVAVTTPDWAQEAAMAAMLPERREYVRELLVRNRKHVRDLKDLYGGICQITGKQVLGGLAGDLTEVHHIKWLTHGGSDDPSNMIVISPDLHAAIHATNGKLEWHAGKPVFVIGGRSMPVAVNRHLEPPGA
jgi:hypothetical protein